MLEQPGTTDDARSFAEAMRTMIEEGFTQFRTAKYEGSVTDTPNFDLSQHEKMIFSWWGAHVGENIEHWALIASPSPKKAVKRRKRLPA